MTHSAPVIGRRQLARLISLAAAGPAMAAASRPAQATRAMAATAFPGTPAVLVAGPDGGAMARWAAAITPPLGRALPSPAMRETTVGGVDGVTGANQFDTRTPADGATALLAPGDAALAWLVGDPRARFDVAHWVPVLAGATPGVLVGRAALAPGKRLRIGAAGPAGADLPALLALDLLGIPCEPVFGLGEAQALSAFSSGETDLVLLRGAGVPARLAALPGARPLLGFGASDESGQLVRDPLAPDAPSLPEVHAALRGGAPDGSLFEAWRAAAAASQLAFGLVLPRLTPPEMVALWRRAGNAASLAPEMQAMAASSATRPLATQAATAGIARIAVDSASLLELRRWLAERYGWHAS